MAIRRLAGAWLPPFAWLALIFIGSTDVLSAEHTSRFLVPLLRWIDPTIAPQTIATIHFAIRKLGHVTEYAILASLMWRALRLSFPSTTRLSIAIAAFGVAVLFAASDEFHQSFFTSRTASPRDVAIDSAGALLAIAVCWFVSTRRLSKR